MPPKAVASLEGDGAQGTATRSKSARQCMYGPKVGYRAGLIPSGALCSWSRRCQHTCEEGGARRTSAVATRRARSHGEGHHEWP